MRHPDTVIALPQVQPPEADEQPAEPEEQHDADPRVERACVRSAAEQAGEEVEARGKQREPAQGEEHQARRRDPMIDASARRVAVDDYRLR